MKTAPVSARMGALAAIAAETRSALKDMTAISNKDSSDP